MYHVAEFYITDKIENNEDVLLDDIKKMFDELIEENKCEIIKHNLKFRDDLNFKEYDDGTKIYYYVVDCGLIDKTYVFMSKEVND